MLELTLLFGGTNVGEKNACGLDELQIYHPVIQLEYRLKVAQAVSLDEDVHKVLAKSFTKDRILGYIPDNFDDKKLNSFCNPGGTPVWRGLPLFHILRLFVFHRAASHTFFTRQVFQKLK